MKEPIKLKLDIPRDSRIIAISDIHGGVNLLKEILEMVQFCDDD